MSMGLRVAYEEPKDNDNRHTNMYRYFLCSSIKKGNVW